MISCPGCRRQYFIASDANGALARCAACLSYFSVVVTEPAGPGEAIILDEPLFFRSSFMYESTSYVAVKVKALFDLAREPFTQETLVHFVANLPRSHADASDDAWGRGYCVEVMRKAHERCRETPGIWPEYEDLVRYFIDHIPGRHNESLDTVINAFVGVLSVPFDPPTAPSTIPDPKPETAAPVARPRLGRLWRAMIFLRLAKAPV